jgi:hypothetical protein
MTVPARVVVAGDHAGRVSGVTCRMGRNLECPRAWARGSEMRTGRAPGFARVALAVIRIANGSTALVAPTVLTRNLGIGRDDNQAIQYVFRMFGIRTVLIGLELLLPEGEVRAAAVRAAPVIHASDTASAALAGLTRQIPARSAVIATSISALNTALALTASAGQRRPRATT